MRGDTHTEKLGSREKVWRGWGFLCVFGLFVVFVLFFKALGSPNDPNDDKRPGRAGTRRGTSERKEFCCVPLCGAVQNHRGVKVSHPPVMVLRDHKITEWLREGRELKCQPVPTPVTERHHYYGEPASAAGYARQLVHQNSNSSPSPLMAFESLCQKPLEHSMRKRINCMGPYVLGGSLFKVPSEKNMAITHSKMLSLSQESDLGEHCRVKLDRFIANLKTQTEGDQEDSNTAASDLTSLRVCTRPWKPYPSGKWLNENSLTSLPLQDNSGDLEQ